MRKNNNNFLSSLILSVFVCFLVLSGLPSMKGHCPPFYTDSRLYLIPVIQSYTVNGSSLFRLLCRF